LNWEDCAQNMTARVDKTWRQLSSQKFRSVLDLVSKKADHSVLRLLQISQQHIESQLDRVRHERELWKEVVDKRAQQPLQLALTLKDPQTGAPLGPPGYPMNQGGPQFQQQGMLPPTGMMYSAGGESPRGMMGASQMGPPGMGLPGSDTVPGGAMKAPPLVKRIAARPQGPPPK